MVGPLSVVEWEAQRRQVAAGIVPVWALAGGKLLVRTQSIGGVGALVTAGGAILLDAGLVSGALMTLRYVAVVPDLAADTAVTALGAALERVVLLCAVALYRDAKGLPAGAAGSQYQSALALAKARDVPLGVMHLGGRRMDRGGGVGRNPTFTLDESRMT